MGYASEYYDPQKAHEYYEKNKKLKGRRSTKGFNESQKAMYSYVKNDLKQREKNDKSAASEVTKQKKSDISEKAKAKRQAFTEECKRKVAALRDKMKNMSKSEKAIAKERINAQIAAIREQFADKKANVSEKASADKKKESANLKVKKEGIHAAYDQKLTEAYNSIKSQKKVAK